jgi:hypothetical protein
MGAADVGNVEAGQALIDAGANKDWMSIGPGHTEDGGNALMKAIDNGHTKPHGASFVDMLFASGVDTNMVRFDDGRTALSHAAGYYNPDDAGKRDMRTALMLLLCGADVRHKDNDGTTPIDEATAAGNLAMAACFKTCADWSPFEIAIACRFHRMAQLMLKSGTITPGPLADKVGSLRQISAADPDTLWPGSPAPCAATTKLMNAAMERWSPERHQLYHGGVRTGIRAVLLVAIRLQQTGIKTAVKQPQRGYRRQLPSARSAPCRVVAVKRPVPREIWLLIGSFFDRSSWLVAESSQCQLCIKKRAGLKRCQDNGMTTDPSASWQCDGYHSVPYEDQTI